MNLITFNKSIKIDSEIKSLKFLKRRIQALMNCKIFDVAIDIKYEISDAKGNIKENFLSDINCFDTTTDSELQKNILKCIDDKIIELQTEFNKL